MSFYLSQFLIAFFATMGFALFFNCPKRVFITSCTLSGIVWVIYKYLVLRTNNVITAGFTASFILGVVSEFFARKYKTPAIIFILPGLVPMIPGAGTYYSMYYLIYKEYTTFQNVASETFYILIALALGIVVATGVSRVFITIMNKIKKKETA